MKRALDTAANVAIILLCAVGLAVLIRGHWHAETGPPVAEVGETLDAVRPLLDSGVAKTLFVALSPDCRYCTESLPFYERLGAIVTRNDMSVRLIGVVHEEADRALQARLMAQHGVVFDDLVVASFPETLEVQATPTLVLVDARAEVLGVWEGRLAKEAQTEVVRALG